MFSDSGPVRPIIDIFGDDVVNVVSNKKDPKLAIFDEDGQDGDRRISKKNKQTKKTSGGLFDDEEKPKNLIKPINPALLDDGSDGEASHANEHNADGLLLNRDPKSAKELFNDGTGEKEKLDVVDLFASSPRKKKAAEVVEKPRSKTRVREDIDLGLDLDINNNEKQGKKNDIFFDEDTEALSEEKADELFKRKVTAREMELLRAGKLKPEKPSNDYYETSDFGVVYISEKTKKRKQQISNKPTADDLFDTNNMFTKTEKKVEEEKKPSTLEKKAVLPDKKTLTSEDTKHLLDDDDLFSAKKIKGIDDNLFGENEKTVSNKNQDTIKKEIYGDGKKSKKTNVKNPKSVPKKSNKEAEKKIDENVRNMKSKENADKRDLFGNEIFPIQTIDIFGDTSAKQQSTKSDVDVTEKQEKIGVSKNIFDDTITKQEVGEYAEQKKSNDSNAKKVDDLFSSDNSNPQKSMDNLVENKDNVSIISLEIPAKAKDSGTIMPSASSKSSKKTPVANLFDECLFEKPSFKNMDFSATPTIDIFAPSSKLEKKNSLFETELKNAELKRIQKEKIEAERKKKEEEDKARISEERKAKKLEEERKRNIEAEERKRIEEKMIEDKKREEIKIQEKQRIEREQKERELLIERQRKLEEERLEEEQRKNEEHERLIREINRRKEEELRIAEEKKRIEEENRVAEEKRRAEEIARMKREESLKSKLFSGDIFDDITAVAPAKVPSIFQDEKETKQKETGPNALHLDVIPVIDKTGYDGSLFAEKYYPTSSNKKSSYETHSIISSDSTRKPKANFDTFLFDEKPDERVGKSNIPKGLFDEESSSKNSSKSSKGIFDEDNKKQKPIVLKEKKVTNLFDDDVIITVSAKEHSVSKEKESNIKKSTSKSGSLQKKTIKKQSRTIFDDDDIVIPSKNTYTNPNKRNLNLFDDDMFSIKGKSQKQANEHDSNIQSEQEIDQKVDLERKLKEEQERKQKDELEMKQKEELEGKQKEELEKKQKEELERVHKDEQERKQKDEQERKQKEELERKQKEEQERKQKEEQERKQKEEQERKQKEEQERKQKEEQERKQKEEQERKQKEEQERKQKEEQERKQKEEQERKQKEELERKHNEEQERKQKEEQERKQKEEQERKQKEELERKQKDEQERKQKDELERKQKDEQERKQKEELERKQKEEHERKHNEEQERKQKDELERKHKEELERVHKEEQERKPVSKKASHIATLQNIPIRLPGQVNPHINKTSLEKKTPPAPEPQVICSDTSIKRKLIKPGRRPPTLPKK